jgi:predicted ArsR family transcriptional regulator
MQADPRGRADTTVTSPNAPEPSTPAAGLRGDLLTELRRNGPASSDQLAERLRASRTGVVQQLRSLESAGLVSREPVRHGVGRPRHLYDVTPAAQALFPVGYDALAAGLLEALETIGGPELVRSVFEARRRRQAERLRTALAERVGTDAPLVERARELAVIQDEAGYLCSAEPDGEGGVRLVEHNCAILGVAKADLAACDAELALFSEVLDAEVIREGHIAAGDRACAYRVRPRD